MPTTSPSTQGAVTGPLQQGTPTDREQIATLSRLEGVREGHLAEGISKRASDLILSGWSAGTNATYQSGWAKWSSWCAARKVNPFSGDVQSFLDFLAQLYQQELQHRSINTIRSAVSMTHKQIEGVPICQHPLVTRILKGVYNSRPPLPRYSSTWDMEIVTKHILSMGNNEDLSLKQLSQKLVVLMALVQASRTSELKALDQVQSL